MHHSSDRIRYDCDHTHGGDGRARDHSRNPRVHVHAYDVRLRKNSCNIRFHVYGHIHCGGCACGHARHCSHYDYDADVRNSNLHGRGHVHDYAHGGDNNHACYAF